MTSQATLAAEALLDTTPHTAIDIIASIESQFMALMAENEGLKRQNLSLHHLLNYNAENAQKIQRVRQVFMDAMAELGCPQPANDRANHFYDVIVCQGDSGITVIFDGPAIWNRGSWCSRVRNTWEKAWNLGNDRLGGYQPIFEARMN